MKKLIVIMVLSHIIIGICNGCSKQQLPMSEYPLTEATIEAALTKAELFWTIANRVDFDEDRVYYELVNEDKKEIAVISSVGGLGKRLLQINLLFTSTTSVPLPPEDWGKTVRLATILFGGFEHENQIFDTFQNTFNEKALIDGIPGTDPKDQERIRWSDDINNVNCFIALRRRNIKSDSPTTEMVSIIISTSENFSTDIQADD